MPGKRGAAVKTAVYHKFKGADFSTDPALVDRSRSPLCTNMISDGGGMPEKRPGWESLCRMPGRIWGIFSLKSREKEYFYVHTGEWLRLWDGEPASSGKLLLDGMSQNKSRAVSLGGSLWIVTGGEFIECRDGSARRVAGGGYIPTTVISRSPSGGGVLYESVNLLSSYRRNSFCCDGESRDYYLDSDSLDTAFILKENIESPQDFYFDDGGVFYVFHLSGRAGQRLKLDFASEKFFIGGMEGDMLPYAEAMGSPIESVGFMTEDSLVRVQYRGEDFEGFGLSRAEGKLSFSEAFPLSETGEDELSVSFPRTVEGYAEMITGCRVISAYGVGGSDRLVLSGNPDYPNRDWISAFNDPTYFPDLGYSLIGLEDSAIMGYCRVGSELAIVKSESGSDSSVFLRSASVDAEGNVSFPVRQALSGVGAVASGGFANLLDEPLFVSGTGIYAISLNLTGDRAGQNRSFYLNARLTAEDMAEAEAVSWMGMYLLSFPNGHVYILDGRQEKTYRSESLGDFCYEGWYWENVPALCWLNLRREGREELYFGTAEGKICRFKTDKNRMDCFSDDGEAIDALWATRMDDDGCATVLKTMIKRGCAVTLKPYCRSSARICFRTDRDSSAKESAFDTVDIFSWEDIDFSRFTFDSNDSAREIFFGTKVKKYKRLQIIIRNNAVNEGFGIFAITKNYVEGNYAKR